MADDGVIAAAASHQNAHIHALRGHRDGVALERAAYKNVGAARVGHRDRGRPHDDRLLLVFWKINGPGAVLENQVVGQGLHACREIGRTDRGRHGHRCSCSPVGPGFDPASTAVVDHRIVASIERGLDAVWQKHWHTQHVASAAPTIDARKRSGQGLLLQRPRVGHEGVEDVVGTGASRCEVGVDVAPGRDRSVGAGQADVRSKPTQAGEFGDAASIGLYLNEAVAPDIAGLGGVGKVHRGHRRAGRRVTDVGGIDHLGRRPGIVVHLQLEPGRARDDDRVVEVHLDPDVVTLDRDVARVVVGPIDLGHGADRHRRHT